MIIINFFGGSYGNFLHHFLNHNISNKSITKSGDFHLNLKRAEVETKLTHEDVLPGDKFNIKITYHKKNIDLISRMKWHKNFWETPESFEIFHVDSVKKCSNITRQIAVMCFYKVSLLSKLDYWNRKDTENTMYIPFDYFLLEIDGWIDVWSKIFRSLNIPVEREYLKQAHKIFNKSQKTIFETHAKNSTLHWKNKDLIAKSNLLAQVFFEKHAKENTPIPIPRYSDTMQMLCEWTQQLDKNNGDLSQLF